MTKSKKPTGPTITKSTHLSLPAESICLIIEASGKAGVRVLKWGDLYLSFGLPTSVMTPSYIPEPPLVQEPNHKQQNLDTLRQDEDTLRAEQLRMMLLEDPMEYERQLRDNELDEDDEDKDEEVE